MDAPTPADPPARTPRRITRRGMLLVGGSVAATAFAGGWARWIEPTWLRVLGLDLPVPGLGPAWDGTTVALFSDTHVGPHVAPEYLRESVARLQGLGADLIAGAGDFATLGPLSRCREAADLLAPLEAPLGVFACLGNHDYGVGRPLKPGRSAPPSPMIGPLEAAGVRVLENAGVRLEREGQPLHVAGVGDIFTGRFRPEKALAPVPAGEPRLVLCHNPDGADAIDAVGPAAILCGHTHGGQFRIPFFGAPVLPIRHKERAEGLMRVGGSALFVTRGVGNLHGVRLNCRPEVVALTLRPAAGTTA